MIADVAETGIKKQHGNVVYWKDLSANGLSTSSENGWL